MRVYRDGRYEAVESPSAVLISRKGPSQTSAPNVGS